MKKILFLMMVCLCINVEAQTAVKIAELETRYLELGLKVMDLQFKLDSLMEIVDHLQYAASLESLEDESDPVVKEDLLKGNNNNETAIYHLMADYLNCRTYKERYQYVIHDPKTLGRMKDYYSSDFIGTVGTTNYEKRDFIIQGSDIATMKKAIPVYFVGKKTLYYVVRTTDGYKIDWEGSVMYNDDLWNSLINHDLSYTQTIVAEISRYHSMSKYGTIEFSYNCANASSYAYVKSSSSPVYKQLMSLCKEEGKRYHVKIQVSRVYADPDLKSFLFIHKLLGTSSSRF